MSDHLPECAEYHPSGDGFDLCICDRLRACEQRVEESMDRAWTQTVQLVEAHARVSAYAAGVQAARDAVADCRVPWPTATGDLVNEGVDAALAAIDALRGQ